MKSTAIQSIGNGFSTMLNHLLTSVKSALSSQTIVTGPLPDVTAAVPELGTNAISGGEAGAVEFAGLFPKMIGPEVIVPHQINGLIINELTSIRSSSESGEYQRDTQPPLVSFELAKLGDDTAGRDLEERISALQSRQDMLRQNVAILRNQLGRLQTVRARLIGEAGPMLDLSGTLLSQLTDKLGQSFGPPLSGAFDNWSPANGDLAIIKSTDTIGNSAEHYGLEAFNDGDPISQLTHAIRNQMRID
ncbi:hypothetical protein GNI_129650 [Gregarina niphandrodes]|uniref:Uncharacterized protein n=1 Tax=Gregarina niphandrodes TaxID=110365 RepID=A0A023B1L0_GRENI|nr:hypothetical protein GNI_129650 [Gregarina niphandrodes]EZG48226.1 hypothetical protein GNI_129650 [Gregarina niphandrodes]|eukprot:XP_011132122.1 hypothetical protein GNI_129650 [Gregarina niphandrodes]